MSSKDREQEILQLLLQHSERSVTDLARDLSVSRATVHRDLIELEKRELVRRFHGGAALMSGTRLEMLFDEKMRLQAEAKTVIADAALSLVRDGDTIYLDGGSTVLKLAERLLERRGLKIVTNSIMVAARLLDTRHDLYLTGGEFRSLSRTLVGTLTGPVIETLRVDTAFMGTIGFSLEDGMTTTDPDEAWTKEQVMKRAGTVVLLADSSKFGLSSFARSGGLNDLHVIICDRITEFYRSELERLGIELMLAEPLREAVAG